MPRRSKRSIRPAATALVAAALTACGGVQSALDPAGPEAAQTATWWWILLVIAVIVFAVVVIMLLAGLFRGRRPDGTGGDGRAIGLIMILGALVPALVVGTVMGVNIYVERTTSHDNDAPAVTIRVTGKRWWWQVTYPDQGIVTANEIHVPAGKTVKLLLTSDNVAHSFWVPKLSGKRDLIPGQVNVLVIRADKPGVYRGQCAEYCGLEHAKMAFLVIADDPSAFQSWVEQQKQAAPEPVTADVRRGQQVFLSAACVYCHRVAGTNATSEFGPDLTHLASRQTLAAGTITNTRSNLSGWIVNSQTIKPGNKMPPMYLDSDDLNALLDYLGTLK